MLYALVVIQIQARGLKPWAYSLKIVHNNCEFEHKSNNRGFGSFLS